jgi:hypothetical protein
MAQIISFRPVRAPAPSIGMRLIGWFQAQLRIGPRSVTADDLPDRLRRDLGLEGYGRLPGTRYHDYPSTRWR